MDRRDAMARLGEELLEAGEVLVSCSHGELAAIMMPGQRCTLCEAGAGCRVPEESWHRSRETGLLGA